MKLSQAIKNIREAKDTVEFIPTGFKKIDSVLDGGFMRRELVVLGGFTGSGKSYLAGQIFYNAIQSGFNSIYFSLEISNQMIASRLIGQIADIKPTLLIAGQVTEEEEERRIYAETLLEGFDSLAHIHDEDYDLKDIEKKITEAKPDFVVIDFIQNVLSKGEDEYTRLSTVALQLQRIAKELNCCILVLSQLSNSAAKSPDGQLEFKGSGSIATVADLGLILTRVDMASGAKFQELNLYVKKNRRGFAGNAVVMKMRAPGGRIEEE